MSDDAVPFDGNGAPLSGRRVLVTGASGGIGAAVARRVLAAGGKAALLARRENRIAALVSELGSGAAAFPCDVTDDTALRIAVSAAADALGGIDAIVANAGAAHMGHISSGDPAVWRECIGLNLLACLSTARYGLDHITTTPADIVLIGSTAALRPTEATGIYSASKSAVAAAAESLRLELGTRGIRVCLLEPGRVDTEIGQNARLEAGGRHGTMGTGFTPLTADEVAGVVEFVLSRPPNLALNTVVLRPVAQTFP
jgi:NADP-dependent 3-hydroxy acid dehydrogenase YdfG